MAVTPTCGSGDPKGGKSVHRHGRSFQTDPFPYTRCYMDVHLIDGTYELFRHFYAVPAAADVSGREIGAAAL